MRKLNIQFHVLIIFHLPKQVTGVNEDSPVWSTFNLSPTIAENAPVGTTVVTVSATDKDTGPDGIVSYAIVSISTSKC